MRSSQVLALLACALLIACETSAPRSSVEYGNAAQVGAWQFQAAGGTSGAGIAAAGIGATTAGIGGNSAGIGGIVGAAGSDGSFAGIGAVTAGVGGSVGSAGIGGSAGDGGSAGSGMTVGGPTSLSFDVLTHSHNGRYAPRNVGAIWVETAAGQFVKTLEVWAFIRASHLPKWNSETGANRVDAISGATLSNHKLHHVTWPLTDTTGAPVPDGAYKMIVEVNDSDGPSDFVSVDFTKGPTPMTLMPPDEPHYTGMQLVLQ